MSNHSATVSDLSTAAMGGNRRAEIMELTWAYEDALRRMAAKMTTSETIFDRAGNNIGTLSWAPKNAS